MQHPEADNTRPVKRALSTNNNSKMHERNLYKDNPPDFAQLANLYPSFAKHVVWKNGQPTLDWNNPDSICELTKALLHKDFGVTVELPVDQLCPTVTSRVNYILWIEDLLGTHTRPSKKAKIQDDSDVSSGTHTVIGIDVGTGASCIYPLLGVAMNKWKFVATDIDEKSIEWATKNVHLNNWEDTITLRHVTDGSTLLSVFPSDIAETNDYAEDYQFCMSNPPFFEHLDEKIENPRRALCQATDGELVTEGGEVAFLTRMIDESLILRNKIRWYTSLLGRKINVKKVLKILRSKGITNTRTTTFYQGHTSRWGIAWSFSDSEDDLRRKTIESLQGTKEFCFSVVGYPVATLTGKIEALLKENQVSWNLDPDNPFSFVASVYQSSRLLKLLDSGSSDSDDEEEDASPVACIGPIMPPILSFAFTINIYQVSNQNYSIKMALTKGEAGKPFCFLYLALKTSLQSSV